MRRLENRYPSLGPIEVSNPSPSARNCLCARLLRVEHRAAPSRIGPAPNAGTQTHCNSQLPAAALMLFASREPLPLQARPPSRTEVPDGLAVVQGTLHQSALRAAELRRLVGEQLAYSWQLFIGYPIRGDA